MSRWAQNSKNWAAITNSLNIIILIFDNHPLIRLYLKIGGKVRFNESNINKTWKFNWIDFGTHDFIKNR